MTLYVDDDNITAPWDGTKEHPYQNITSALANSTDGHVIFVRAGIYYEHVIIDKSISLIGEGRDSTIIDGSGIGTVISITAAASNVSLKGFTIKNSGITPSDSGILVERSNDNTISHNIIINNYYGISLRARGNMVSDNVISSNTYGINLQSSSTDNMISDNVISFNIVYGISIDTSVNNVVLNNSISDNSDGIYFFYSTGNMVSGNTFFSNDVYGIGFFTSSNNIVSSNTITSNDGGMYLSASASNVIYGNNFDNALQVKLVGIPLANVWDDGEKGNYWSDYNGIDTNGDGIGDTIYTIDVNNQDKYPLMGTFSDFNITLERDTYHVTTICNSTVSDFRFETGLETGNRIIRFRVTGEEGTVGFCRIMIPTELMDYYYVILVDDKETLPTLLEAISDETYVHLYFTYKHSSHTITVISSLVRKLEIDLYNLNATYYGLLKNYSELQQSYNETNKSYQAHLANYSALLGNYSELQQGYRALNDSYHEYL
ncbi:MAG: pectinesterase family protein, partial [Candidatus Bathyarchaeota archaeon]|nr:pectinesterase family protein [Candidatus Bathyarchaeota archaeon]